MKFVEKSAQRLKLLDQVVEGYRSMLVVMHDYPDPDALASAMTLAYLVRVRYRMRTKMAFGGHIARAENRAMVRQLGLRLTPVSKIRWPRYKCVALVDTQPGFGNNSMPAEIEPKIVIDHHPAKSPPAGDFVDLRTDYGASATVLLEYLRAAQINVPVDIATAITYAIRSETQELGRDASEADVQAYLSVYPRANKRKLARMANPKLPNAYFVLLHTALQNAKVFRHLSHVHLGPVESPEFVPQIADLLLRQERIGWALVTGQYDAKLFVSLRSSQPNANAGSVLKRMLRNLGSAGGHNMMAGGRVDLADVGEPGWPEIQETVLKRFLQRLGYKTSTEWRPLLERNGKVKDDEQSQPERQSL